MVAASNAAPQHAPYAPRPLPLFLDIARQVTGNDPAMMARVLAGLRRYETAQRPTPRLSPPVQLGPMCAWTAGDEGPWVVLIPSLINPAWVMDLGDKRSLLRWLGNQGFRVALLDWESVGDARYTNRDLAAHVADLLLPAISSLNEPAHIVGYCLGGVLAAGAATQIAALSLSLVATPWHFDRYPAQARHMLINMWVQNRGVVEKLGVLPMELLQTAFWNLDPQRTVHKFAAIADASDDDPELAAFILLEDWANSGAALTAAAAHDLFQKLFAENALAGSNWAVADKAVQPSTLGCRARQFTATDDRIVPAASACDSIDAVACPSGHVGMMVGRGAFDGFWIPLRNWLCEATPG
jgi:polyhydroxyalkanoate synthase subunit PhaC